MNNMAANYIVYVPDRSEPFTGFPQSLTHDEVRSALVATGHTSVENAELVVNGTTLRFRRVQGGTKGI